MKQIIKNLMKHTRHAELVSASHSVILRCQRHSPIRCWYNFKASLRVAKNLKLAPSLALPLKGRGKSASSAIPTSKSIKVVPMSTDRAMCVAHDKNLSSYRLNVLETDNTPTLSRICKFAYRSLTNSTLSQRERVKYGFTLAEVFSPCRKVKLNFGFTLVEVLITLGIIGVVAAVTLPSLIQNYQKHVTENKLKKVYSQLLQVNQLALNDFGPSEYWDYSLTGEEFFEKYYVPYMKLQKFKTNMKILLNSRIYSAIDTGSDDRNRNNYGSRWISADGICYNIHKNNQFLFLEVDFKCLQGSKRIIGKDIFDIAEFWAYGPKKMVVPKYKSTHGEKYLNEELRNEAKEVCKSWYSVAWPGPCFTIFVHDGMKFKNDYPIKF